MVQLSKGVGKGGRRGWGASPPQILSSYYYVYKWLPQKDIQNLENNRGKTAFISCMSHVSTADQSETKVLYS